MICRWKMTLNFLSFHFYIEPNCLGVLGRSPANKHTYTWGPFHKPRAHNGPYTYHLWQPKLLEFSRLGCFADVALRLSAKRAPHHQDLSEVLIFRLASCSMESLLSSSVRSRQSINIPVLSGVEVGFHISDKSRVEQTLKSYSH